jgi:uncharacterized membrane protein
MADSPAEAAEDSVPDPTDAVKDKVKDFAQSDDDNGLIAPLKKVAVAAALAALTPVVKDAVTNAAESAVNKVPEVIENAGGMDGIVDSAKEKVEEAGGVGGVAKLAMDQLGGGNGGMLSSAMGTLTGGALGGDDDSDGGGKPPDGTGSGRRMPVQQAVDVAAPVEVVYNQFTQFEEWTKIMHRVESSSQEDEGHVRFKTNQWAVNREWEAEITDQRPDERIAWKTTSGPNLTGVATFHELAPRLTRVEINVDFAPQGFFEKIGRGWRFAKRAIRADLHRFKAYVEMHEEETGEWRGYIIDGEVVDEQDYFGGETAEDQEGEPEAEEDQEGEPEAEERPEEEPADEEDLDDEELDEEDDEDEEPAEEPVAEEDDESEEEAPARTRSTKSRASKNGGSTSSRSSKPRGSKSSQSSKSKSAAPKSSQSSKSAASKSSRNRRTKSSSRDGARASSAGSSKSSGSSRSRSSKGNSAGKSSAGGRARSSRRGKSSSAKKGSGGSRAKAGGGSGSTTVTPEWLKQYT